MWGDLVTIWATRDQNLIDEIWATSSATSTPTTNVYAFSIDFGA
ncbi:hypothetical protein ACFW96_38720 [Streptomyces gardneri]